MNLEGKNIYISFCIRFFDGGMRERGVNNRVVCFLFCNFVGVGLWCFKGRVSYFLFFG